jgi:hypothetical protein
MLNFDVELEPTLDESYPVIVYSIKGYNEEYVFQFACNKKELYNLKNAIEEALAHIKRNKEREEADKIQRAELVLCFESQYRKIKDVDKTWDIIHSITFEIQMENDDDS